MLSMPRLLDLFSGRFGWSRIFAAIMLNGCSKEHLDTSVRRDIMRLLTVRGG